MDRLEIASSMWFQKIEGIGAKTLFQLKENFGSLQAAYHGTQKELLRLLNSKQYTAFKAAKHCLEPVAYMEQVEKKGIRYIAYEDEIFPEKLRNIPDPPYGLFVKGSLPDVGVPSIAMIGARACSEYGRAVAEEFAAALAGLGVQVISGMARGIDSISQKSCLKAGGRTFAVLGSGVDVCYPGELRDLYEEIEKNGGLLSTYAPGMPPVSSNFPPRNRIISGLSDVVLVVEARRKSGTLITVDMALEQGKEVAIIPGRITDSLSQGCHDLLSQGAGIVVNIEQLVSLLSDTFSLQFSSGKDISNGYKKEASWIDIINSNELDPALKSIYEILLEHPTEPMDAESIYKKWLERNGQGEFRALMEGLVDLELMDLCKSYKNRFTIR